MRLLPRTLSFALLLVAASLPAQVGVKKGAVVYHGSASNTSAPAVIQEGKVKEATPEWKRIQSEGIDQGSAQGKQLLVQMTTRIKNAAKEAAEEAGRDMVARKDDITDKQGRDVVDLTDKVVAKVGA
ncbi:MAG: hypothetical protein WAT39_24125 [Planctomycetota bacterium]